MAIKHCKECGTEISSSAKTCPKCGKEQRNFFQKHTVLTVILVIIVLGVIVSATGGNKSNSNTISTSTTTIKEPEVIEYTSIHIDELEEALKNNAAAAKDNYNGKYLEITGRLGTIDSDLKYISLLSTTNEWDIVGIHCTIKNDKQKEIIKTLTKDDTIVVKGKITDVGEVLGYRLDITEIVK